MKLSELQAKKIVNITTGTNMGMVSDVVISSDGKIEAFIIDSGRGLFSLNREGDMRIYWNQIIKIGEDVILIKRE